MSITMGCDPELFLFDNLEQRIVPAVGKIGGSKTKPMKLDGGMVQLDGTLVEFGIDPDGDIGKVINIIRTKLDNRYHGRYELRCGSTVAYDPRDISPDSPALDVGCSPQFMFDQRRNLVQVSSGITQTPIDRVHAGGHIHIGFTQDQRIDDPVMLQSCYMFSRCLRSVTDIESGGSLRRLDVLNNTRLPVIRIKPYGIEWRNPCSYWLADKDIFPLFGDLMEHIFQQLCLGYTHENIMASPYYQQVRAKLFVKSALISRAALCVPEKYQGTLPLDY